MALDIEKHPCFSADARHKFGRIHLPVAPRCNMQCNFCNRKYDCMNESRPGVTSVILSPQQALAYTEEVLAKRPEIAVVGIAGPGDPFANPDETMETLRLVRGKFSEMILCLASNGLGIAPFIDELAELQTSHVTITINAVDPGIGAKIYAWVRDRKTPRRGEKAAALLLERQLEAVHKLKEKGLIVKVNTIIMPGINDHHIMDVAVKMAELRVDIMNCMAFYPVEGSVFQDLTAPTALEVSKTRLKAGGHLPQMSHCARCRADAVGLLSETMDEKQMTALKEFSRMPVGPDEKRPYVAAVSMEGVLVNQHLGEARCVFIYGEDENGSKLIETRQMPEAGGGTRRWLDLANLLKDCAAILVNASGPKPRQVLAQEGIRVIEMEGMIKDGLDAVFEGREIPAAMRRRFNGCADGCKGPGTGCG